MLKIELGGGVNPLGGEWINCDLLAMPGVDQVVDFERLGKNGVRLPFDDDAVDAVYSSHSLEHVKNAVGVLREICRVGKLGASVEIRVPHWLSDIAHCPGHVHVMSEHWFEDICIHFYREWFAGCTKRLKPTATYYIDWRNFERAKRLLPRWSDQDIRDFIPGCVHECRFHFEVIAHVG